MYVMSKRNSGRTGSTGFTLIEMMLSIALIAIIAGLSAPVYQSFQTRNDLDIVAVTIAHSLRRAQLLAQASDGDSSWGVAVQASGISLFKGISYVARDASYDEIFDLPGSLTPSGVSEIVFAKFTGLPQTTGTVTITSNTNEIRSITINQKGMVAY